MGICEGFTALNQLAGGVNGVEADETDGGLLSEDGDQDIVLVDGGHEDVGVFALVVEGAELNLADPAGQLLGGGKGTGGQRGQDGGVGNVEIALLRDDGASLVNHDSQVGFGLLKKILEDRVQLLNVFDGQNGYGFHRRPPFTSPST